MLFTITIFPNIKQPQNKREYSVSWEGLAGFLTRSRPSCEKVKQCTWTPYTFAGKRSNANAQKTNLVVFDFDEGAAPFETTAAILKEHEIAHIMHTTFSHTEETPKYRLILPLGFFIDSADQIHLFNASQQFAEDFLKQPTDPACKDPARCYFTSYTTPAGVLQKSFLPIEGNQILPWKEGIQRAKAETKQREAKKAKRREAAKKSINERIEAMQCRKPLTEAECEGMKQKAKDTFYSKHFRFLTRSDEKRYMYALMKCDAETRQTTAEKLQCTIKDGRAQGFHCPFCGRNDATFFYIDPTRSTGAFCGHIKTCSDDPENKSPRGFDLGYVAEMEDLI